MAHLSPGRVPLLSLGFRPFFLLAAAWSVAALLVWIGALAEGFELPSRFDPLTWHVHEMLFGVLMAVVAGFLLTAMPNWTGQPPMRGLQLAALAALWGLGRVVCLVSASLPVWLTTSVDTAFPVALAVTATGMLVSAGNRRNYPLLLPLGALGFGSLLMHLEAAGVAIPAGLGWRLGLGCTMLLIAIIGGRITPAFTRNWLSRHGGGTVPEADHRDAVALVLTVAGLAAWAALPESRLTGALTLVASGCLLLRLSRWQGWRTTAEPLLLVLHLGYLWLAVALGLLGLSIVTPAIPLAAAIHAMTAGTAGTMILGVMARVTLGHTGRPLHADTGTVMSFVLVTLAALLRITAAWPSEFSDDMMVVSGAAWIGAFALFLVRYAPMLVAPRSR